MAATKEQEELLKAALGKIFDRLDQKGQLPSGLTKEDVVNKVFDHLNSEGVINDINLKNPEHQKTLALGIMTEALGMKDPKLKDSGLKLINYAEFFKPTTDQKNDLKFELNNALKLYLSPTDIKKLDKDLDKISEDVAKQSPEEESALANNKRALDVTFQMIDMISITLRNQHGGQDTRYPGKEVSNNIGPLMGNMQGAANYSPPTEKSEMGQQKNQELEDPTRPDYQASRGYMLLDELMIGMADELQAIGAYKPLSEEQSAFKNPFDISKGPSNQ